MTVQRFSIMLDCNDVDRVAAFWCAALGYRSHTSRYGQFQPLRPPEGSGWPVIDLQQVEEPKQGKNRMHLDLHTDDFEAEVARLESLGATRTDDHELGTGGVYWTVMTDPEGNEFCVVAKR